MFCVFCNACPILYQEPGGILHVAQSRDSSQVMEWRRFQDCVKLSILDVLLIPRVSQFFSNDVMGTFVGLCEVEDSRYSRKLYHFRVLQCLSDIMLVTRGNTVCCAVTRFFSSGGMEAFSGLCEVELSRCSSDSQYLAVPLK